MAPATSSTGIVDSNPSPDTEEEHARRRQRLVESVMGWVDDEGVAGPQCPPYVLSGELPRALDRHRSPRAVRKRPRDDDPPLSRWQVRRQEGSSGGRTPRAPQKADRPKGRPKPDAPGAQAPAAVAQRQMTKEEAEEHRKRQRLKQIRYGKDTVGYARYVQQVPKDQRGPDDPRTPDHTSQTLSKRSFDALLKRWRRALHKWDLPTDGPESEPVPFDAVSSPGDDDDDDDFPTTPDAALESHRQSVRERQEHVRHWWTEVQRRACLLGTAHAEAAGVHLRIVERPAGDLRAAFAAPYAQGLSAATAQSVSLRDPVSGAPIEVPVRGPSCRHPQAVDLGAMLRRGPVGPRFVDPVDGQPCASYPCPVCQQPIRSADILLDCYTGGVLYARHQLGAGAPDAFECWPATGRWTLPGFSDHAGLEGTPLGPG